MFYWSRVTQAVLAVEIVIDWAILASVCRLKLWLRARGSNKTGHQREQWIRVGELPKNSQIQQKYIIMYVLTYAQSAQGDEQTAP